PARGASAQAQVNLFAVGRVEVLVEAARRLQRDPPREQARARAEGAFALLVRLAGVLLAVEEVVRHAVEEDAPAGVLEAPRAGEVYLAAREARVRPALLERAG